MKKAAEPSPRWYTAWRARPAASPAMDPADLGTAFGLDLSFRDPEPPRPAAPPVAQGWMARWAARRRAS
jgi:hypothetical protein